MRRRGRDKGCEETRKGIRRVLVVMNICDDGSEKERYGEGAMNQKAPKMYTVQKKDEA